MIFIWIARPRQLAVCTLALAVCTASCSQPAGTASNAAPGVADALAKLSRAVAPTLATVKPPGNPKISHHFISEKMLAELPVPRQPPELAKALSELQVGTIEERKARLKAKVFSDMVYVQGGSFMRGDFAKLMGIEGVTRMTYNEDDKVVKEITLSDFWISKYKVTYAEFDVFTDATGRQRTGMEHGVESRHPIIPAGAYWQTARDYCQWLGQLAGLPMDLPTEAQWEYAARSRGQFFMIPTDDGTIEYGRNIPYGMQARSLSRSLGLAWTERYSVGLFPPNPLGLFDMSYNGPEWVADWYAADYYGKAESRNPQGPSTGSRKVTRSWGSGDSLQIGVAVWRRSAPPLPMSRGVLDDSDKFFPSPTSSSPALRCAVNPTS
jgi:formylglycine-generating enzyme